MADGSNFHKASSSRESTVEKDGKAEDGRNVKF